MITDSLRNFVNSDQQVEQNSQSGTQLKKKKKKKKKKKEKKPQATELPIIDANCEPLEHELKDQSEVEIITNNTASNSTQLVEEKKKPTIHNNSEPLEQEYSSDKPIRGKKKKNKKTPQIVDNSVNIEPDDITVDEKKSGTEFKQEPKIILNQNTHIDFKTVEMESDKKPAIKQLTREQIKEEREAKKLAKLAKKNKSAGSANTNDNDSASTTTLCPESTQPNKNVMNVAGKENKQENTNEKKPALTKAERRVIQEAQRAAKASTSSAKVENKKGTTQIITKSPVKEEVRVAVKVSPIAVSGNDGKVKLFNHLKRANQDATRFANNPLLHPAIARLGEQYAKRTVVGSNARCVAFLNAIKMVIQDFETPPKKEFSRSLETTLKYCVKYLQECRPLAVSVSNACKHIKHVLSQLSADKPESECKEHLCQFIDTYIENQIGKAAEAISVSMQEKIKNGDVLVTFGCSSLIYYICEQAKLRNVDFRVIVVDARPFCEGLEMLRRLTAQEIPCSYVLINAVGFIMPEATKVLLGAHALLSNGYVMARTGTAQVALVARSYNVPVLVCCETHKFSERFQTDAIVYNELADPEDLVRDNKCSLNNWQCKGKLTPLNLMYDITPPELVTAVVTDVSILPCTSVPVILRIKPAEIGYFG